MEMSKAFNLNNIKKEMNLYAASTAEEEEDYGEADVLELTASQQEELDLIPLTGSQEEKFWGSFIEETNKSVPANVKCTKTEPSNTIASRVPYTEHFEQTIQETKPQILTTEEFRGPLNFDIKFNDDHRQSTNVLFSQKLSKIFIHPEAMLTLQFYVSNYIDELWVRAVLVFKMDQHKSDAVLRCPNHRESELKTQHEFSRHLVHHVLRSCNPTSLYYKYKGHYSVMTPLAEPEKNQSSIPLQYQFFCSNSCSSGMNRRPAELIFILENGKREILGRKCIDIRISKCPKRDYMKEEGIQGGNKRSSLQILHVPEGKRIKNENADLTEYTINPKIIGKKNYLDTLNFMYNSMAGSAVSANSLKPYKNTMDDVKNEIKRLQDKD